MVERVLFCSVLFLCALEFRGEVDRWQQVLQLKMATLKVNRLTNCGEVTIRRKYVSFRSSSCEQLSGYAVYLYCTSY